LGRLLNDLAFVVIGLVPVVLIAWLLTAATLPLSRLALTGVALLAAGLPLFALGISIGYSLSTKAALAVAQSLLLPLAFGGGLFLPPETFPAWLDAISTWLPTCAGRDLVVAATTGAGCRGLPCWSWEAGPCSPDRSPCGLTIATRGSASGESDSQDVKTRQTPYTATANSRAR